GANEIATPFVHAYRDRLPYRAIGSVAILKFSRRWIRGLHEREYAPAVSHLRDERHQRVAALVRVDGHGVATEVVFVVAQKSLGIGSRGRADIAALGIRDRNQPKPPGQLDDLAKRAHPLQPARFVKRKLRLDRDRRARARLDDFTAEARQSVTARDSGRAGRIELRIDAEHH